MGEKEKETITGGCRCGKKPEECCGGKGECGGNCHKEKGATPCTGAELHEYVDEDGEKWHGNAS